jgi:uncharacterized protein
MGKMQQLIEAFIQQGRVATALSEAARWGEIGMVQELLENGTPVDARDENGGTALMNAASAGEMKIMRLLLEKGADVNAIDEKKGYTALIWALFALHSEADYLAITRKLLKSGADVTVRGFDGSSAFDLARERNSTKLIQLLESARHG